MKQEPPTMLIAKVDPEFKDLVEKEAKKQGISVSELIRRTLAQRINYQMDEEHMALIRSIGVSLRGVTENRRIIFTMLHALNLWDKKEMISRIQDLSTDLEKLEVFDKYLETGDYAGAFKYVKIAFLGEEHE